MEDNNKIPVLNNDGCHDRLIIVGSGPVAWNVYRFAALIGYHIIVVDNRAETLTRDRFPEASELQLGDVIQLLEECTIDEATSIVIITHHHKYDEAALMAVINSPARYIGIMSNRHAVATYLKKLEHLGIPEERIGRVHTPIGLDIGGQLAAEIALAAVAEIQAVKYDRSGGFMVTKKSSRKKERRDGWF